MLTRLYKTELNNCVKNDDTSETINTKAMSTADKGTWQEDTTKKALSVNLWC